MPLEAEESSLWLVSTTVNVIAEMGMLLTSMSGYRSGQDDRSTCALRSHLFRRSLSAEERASGVYVECLSPLLSGRVHGMYAAHNSGEADQDVDAA